MSRSSEIIDLDERRAERKVQSGETRPQAVCPRVVLPVHSQTGCRMKLPEAFPRVK